MNPPTVTKYHIAVLIADAKGLPAHILDGMVEVDGKLLSADEANTHFDNLLLQGFKYIPQCENVDAAGRCQGHAVERGGDE